MSKRTCYMLWKWTSLLSKLTFPLANNSISTASLFSSCHQLLWMWKKHSLEEFMCERKVRGGALFSQVFSQIHIYITGPGLVAHWNHRNVFVFVIPCSPHLQTCLVTIQVYIAVVRTKPFISIFIIIRTYLLLFLLCAKLTMNSFKWLQNLCLHCFSLILKNVLLLLR